MAEIIRFNDDPHKQTQTLLPWYVNGSLEPDEAARVETHLKDCAECRADLQFEQRLSVDVAALPADAPSGWAELRERALAATQHAEIAELTPRSVFHRRVPLGWVAVAQAASFGAIVVLAALLAARLPWNRPHVSAAYRVLGSAPVAADGNVVVVFQPTISERDLRDVVAGQDARIVDGPTESGAFVLHVAGSQRGAVLAHLRADSHILLAEPIDAGAAP